MWTESEERERWWWCEIVEIAPSHPSTHEDRMVDGTGSRRYGAGPAIDAWTHWLTPTTREATTPRIVGLSNYHQHRDEHQVATLTRLKRKPKS